MLTADTSFRFDLCNTQLTKKQCKKNTAEKKSFLQYFFSCYKHVLNIELWEDFLKKGRKKVIFLKKPIDKAGKSRYNLNEPNGSDKKGGRNEVKEHVLLLDDSELR